MKHQLRPEPVEFLRTAPHRRSWSADLTASPEAVFAALSDEPSTWRTWFPNLKDGHWLADAPDGTRRREVRLALGVRFAETIVRHEAPNRFAYRLDETSVPMCHALIEEWEITPTTTGCRVTWTFAADAKLVLRLTLRLTPFFLGMTFKKACRNLDRQLGRVVS